MNLNLTLNFDIQNLRRLRKIALRARQDYYFDAADWAMSRRKAWRDSPEQAAREFLFELLCASNDLPSYDQMGVQLNSCGKES